jgi:hypothetical protein
LASSDRRRGEAGPVWPGLISERAASASYPPRGRRNAAGLQQDMAVQQHTDGWIPELAKPAELKEHAESPE